YSMTSSKSVAWAALSCSLINIWLSWRISCQRSPVWSAATHLESIERRWREQEAKCMTRYLSECRNDIGASERPTLRRLMSPYARAQGQKVRGPARHCAHLT